MKYEPFLLMAFIAVSTLVYAQSTPPAAVGTPKNSPGSVGTTPGATTMPPAGSSDGMKPGANSFTEAQARDRIEKAGYANVSGLVKSDDGFWRGQATKNGNQVRVSVDFKGNVAPM